MNSINILIRSPECQSENCQERSSVKLLKDLEIDAIYHQPIIDEFNRTLQEGSQTSLQDIKLLKKNATENDSMSDYLLCQCRISPNLGHLGLLFYVRWNVYVFHLICYTLLPAIILIACNTGLLFIPIVVF
mgnify:CR=1 FL=1